MDRTPIEHVFAVQKQPTGLAVRTIGLARARIGMANLAYTRRGLVQHQGRVTARHDIAGPAWPHRRIGSQKAPQTRQRTPTSPRSIRHTPMPTCYNF